MIEQQCTQDKLNNQLISLKITIYDLIIINDNNDDKIVPKMNNQRS